METNVHYPTDSRLLSNGVRVISRLLRRAKKVLGEEATRPGKEAFRTLMSRSVRRLSKKLHRIALRKKSEEAAQELKGAYCQLVRITRASLAQAGRVAGALRQRGQTRAPTVWQTSSSTSFPSSSGASTRRFAVSSERSRSRLCREGFEPLRAAHQDHHSPQSW